MGKKVLRPHKKKYNPSADLDTTVETQPKQATRERCRGISIYIVTALGAAISIEK
jgi:hypothetical protein